jgi:hypothetical protein
MQRLYNNPYRKVPRRGVTTHNTALILRNPLYLMVKKVTEGGHRTCIQ